MEPEEQGPSTQRTHARFLPHSLQAGGRGYRDSHGRVEEGESIRASQPTTIILGRIPPTQASLLTSILAEPIALWIFTGASPQVGLNLPSHPGLPLLLPCPSQLPAPGAPPLPKRGTSFPPPTSSQPPNQVDSTKAGSVASIPYAPSPLSLL